MKTLYYDSNTGFQSADKLYRKAKSIDSKITIKQVQQFLANQSTAQITKEVKRNKTFNTIISPSIRNNYQIDIMYLPNPKQNKNFKYLLTCIDVYSRYAFVLPLKSKTGEETFEAFKKLMQENGNSNNINFDSGKEFIYKPMKDYCKAHDIKLWYSDTEQENKNAIIERFHRTLRNMILRYETANGKAYIDDLQNLVSNYNHTYHNTVKGEPINIWQGKAKNEQEINRVEHSFKVGDSVRHLIKKETFNKKSSTTTYTKKIYKIDRIEGNSIYLEGLTKPFKSFELVKAVGDDATTAYDTTINKAMTAEKIIRRLRKEGII